MPRRTLSPVILLLSFLLVALASPLQAVPLQDLKGQAVPFDPKTEKQQDTPLESWKAQSKVFTTPSIDPISARPTGDPCGFSQDWLRQHKNGTVICGTLADFYAPQVASYPAVQSAGIGNGSRLALFVIGLFALLLATRRPVWISHLMR